MYFMISLRWYYCQLGCLCRHQDAPEDMMTITPVSLRLRSQATQPFAQHIVEAMNKEYIKASHYWAFMRGIHRWIGPLTTDHYRGKCFHVMTSPWDTHWVSDKLASFGVLRLLVVIAIDPFIRQALAESHRRPLTSSQLLCSGCWRAYLFALKYQQKDIP